MNNKYKITITEPCQENWDNMIPNENGRFCMNCAKTVIDFSLMLPEEIQHFFIQNQNEKICGRFKNSQLEAITIQIPIKVLYTQTNYHKMFLLALFIAMGTTLFSCQDKEGNINKIDKIEIVEDSSKTTVNDKPLINDSLNKKSSLPKKSKYRRYGVTVNLPPEMSIGTSGDYNSAGYTLGGAGLLSFAPDYPGGFEKFTEFIKNEFQIPKKARRITGEIEVSFVINKTGTLNEIKIFDNIGYETGEEMVRVLQESKKWIPGITDGKGIPTFIRLNIVVEKDSLNTDRRKRKLSKIVSINRVNENDNQISQIN
ncbi:energy transducer TonB [Flavobacterium bizetiae]|uniref:energy transducer TonB n=1 Tax=Flavobacterium bizetiae TaxID=2704140 RepID=UPI0021E8B7C2|nr:energy transducer TonB [Flavobacterium bizetiae]UTN05827.1 energy transducer TonB [Flavobacterium bizetiae]